MLAEVWQVSTPTLAPPDCCADAGAASAAAVAMPISKREYFSMSISSNF
jgi:hypothetical protein